MQRFAKPPCGVTCFEGSNPSLSASPRSIACARSSVDRALGCGPKGRGFESRRARQHSRSEEALMQGLFPSGARSAALSCNERDPSRHVWVNHPAWRPAWQLAQRSIRRRTPTSSARRAPTPAAFRVLYDRHAGRINAFLLRRTREPGAALELTAETFAQAWLSRDRYTDHRRRDDRALALRDRPTRARIVRSPPRPRTIRPRPTPSDDGHPRVHASRGLARRHR